MRADLEKFIKEAEKFSQAAYIEFERGIRENKDEKIRDGAEKAWNSLVLATTGRHPGILGGGSGKERGYGPQAERGEIVSKTIPGFRVKVEWFFEESVPPVVRCLQSIL